MIEPKHHHAILELQILAAIGRPCEHLKSAKTARGVVIINGVFGGEDQSWVVGISRGYVRVYPLGVESRLAITGALRADAQGQIDVTGMTAPIGWPDH
jgi:hypothetical protein